MDRIRILLSRLAALLRPRQLDDDLDDELREHIELATEENLKRGMKRNEARAAALRSFGGVTRVKESFRVQRGVPFLEQIARDLRFGIRQLRKSPGFALTAILTLALGLGANAAVFSLINGLLLRPLPVPHAEELAVLHYLRTDDPDPNYSYCTLLFRALEKRHDVFKNVAAFTSRTMQVRSASGNVEVRGAIVSGRYFDALETPPLMGRSLTPQDDRPGGASGSFGVVISQGFWRTWFNSAPDVVGRRLTIANAPFTVVGVMPSRFFGADPTKRPELYVPLEAEPIVDAPYNSLAGGYHSWWLRVIARRNAGVTLAQANAMLGAATIPILEATAQDDPAWLRDARKGHLQIAAEPGSSGYSRLRATFVKPLAAVFSLCAAMLVLACLNLASLLMARSAARERELATRLAMGATRRRLVQQLLIESLLIALCGTLAGMIAAPVVSHALAALLVGNDPTTTIDTALDLRVFVFIAVTAVITTVLIGLVPALRATSKSLNEQIKSASHTTSAGERRGLFPRLLMASEVALALLLVVGAGLLATSVVRLYRTGLGFDPHNVVELGLDMGKQPLDGDPLLRWYRQFGDSLKPLPGVKGVGFGSEIPFDGSIWTRDYRSPLSGGDRQLFLNSVSPGYFATMRIPLVAGRDFDWRDTLSTGRKIVLSQSAAKYLLPGVDPIDQSISAADSEGQKLTYQVIGVVGNSHYFSIRDDEPAGAFIPITQDSGHKSSFTAVVRIEGSAAPFAAAARLLAAKTAPEIPAPVLNTLSADIDSSISSERMMAMLAVFFAGCALLVTAIGLYGTLAYATTRRTSEIGIRMALGARRTQVIALVFGENARIAAAGSVVGLAVALVASRALASFLYGTSARDPWVMAGSTAALILIASAASLIPAVRAARIEPIEALRTE
jgi:predicted permease